jgi:hypothetical protein
MRVPKFTTHQLEKAGDIVADIGTVIFASIALPAVFETLKFTTGMSGSLIALLLWSTSLWLHKYSSS